ncbi:type II toxin-antitoxin system VapC family toxin [Agromyces aerolatus]|uniref:type II toxin-antitoxin system VapC family toxin n=1 Tax=Agromyces sp. LY-1074 TaxID=3074080 RepID=UPI00285851DD|nr:MULTISPECIES: type II toxin-antitoxin system VapC family toxin [unclassified Agromyces]MDR5698656.1 type II toxin-antitoxin system VapC family toxin [Agromyces sp. LY-1074]MDR5704950.1 type II toxin-antitoxin system VapC family toxin [Agromyces sp. LY-1358]
MILVDTSVWIDHFRAADSALNTALEHDEVGTHPFVIEELALGSIAQRDTVLDLLGDLRSFPVLRHGEALLLVDRRRLWGRGLSPTDAHLIGAVALVPGARLWTRDKRLASACADLHVSVITD